MFTSGIFSFFFICRGWFKYKNISVIFYMKFIVFFMNFLFEGLRLILDFGIGVSGFCGSFGLWGFGW